MDIKDEYQLLLETLPLGVGIYDENGDMLYVNDAYASILGISDKNILLTGKHNVLDNPLLSEKRKFEIFHSKDNSTFTIHINFRDETIRKYYSSVLTADRDIKVDFRRLSRGPDEEELISVIISDVTEETSRQRELERINLLNNTVIEKMPCMFFMKNVDDDYRYVLANQMFCAAMGKSYKEIIDHTDYDLMVTSQEADHFRHDDQEAAKKGLTSFKEETQWCGIWKVWHTIKLLLTTNTGEHYLIGMSLDITSLDIAFEELRHAKEVAERSDLLKSTFLANMSHEIRTPLNAIVGFSDLLLSAEDHDEKKEYGEIITTNSDLLLKLINDILDLSKIEAGYLDLKNEKVDLSELFEGFRKNFSKRMRHGVQFACINPYNSCIIDIDKNRITQIINNFVSNAIKYTPKGFIKLGYEIEGEGIKFYVEDTGIGISKENQSRVFGRFEKFDSFAQGTGLGLSICKVIAESVGGKIGFSSELGVGSTFWVWVPSNPVVEGDALKPEQEEKVEQLLFTRENVGKINILAAEDNDSNFMLLKALLKDFHVDRAKTGLEAVNMARDNSYSIIFMDLKMPLMSGVEATRLIRAFNHDVPIVALTANAFDSDKNDAMKAGCTYFLTKPLKMSDILCIVGRKVDY